LQIFRQGERRGKRKKSSNYTATGSESSNLTAPEGKLFNYRRRFVDKFAGECSLVITRLSDKVIKARKHRFAGVVGF